MGRASKGQPRWEREKAEVGDIQAASCTHAGKPRRNRPGPRASRGAIDANQCLNGVIFGVLERAADNRLGLRILEQCRHHHAGNDMLEAETIMQRRRRSSGLRMRERVPSAVCLGHARVVSLRRRFGVRTASNAARIRAGNARRGCVDGCGPQSPSTPDRKTRQHRVDGGREFGRRQRRRAAFPAGPARVTTAPAPDDDSSARPRRGAASATRQNMTVE